MKKLTAALLLALAGCAKLPAGAGGTTTLVTFQMTMQQTINQGYVYAIALNPSTSLNPITTGPIPVIGPPWGNGLVAGNWQFIIVWNFALPPSQQAEIFVPDANGQLFLLGQVPISFSESADQLSLTAEIDMSQLSGALAAGQKFQSLQVNFLTASSTPTGSQVVSRMEDALGNQNNPQTINSPITIPLNTAGTYNSRRYQNPPLTGPNFELGSDPSLNIINFSVQVVPG